MTFDTPDQSPLYHAVNKDRYSRQEQIRRIQTKTQRDLIVYVANFIHPNGGIDRNDILGFGDLLNDKAGKDLDLLIQSPGGDIDISEKIIYMCRNNTTSFRVIVAESAKSAATLIALAADSIIMGNTSELGPIDPQVHFLTGTGASVYRPAQSILDGLKSIRKEVDEAEGQLSPVYFPLLQTLDPALIDSCEKAILRSRKFAGKWLTISQCKNDKRKAVKIAEKLSDANKYLSHGTVIDYEEAQTLGLTIEYLKPDDSLWQSLWRLYCEYELDIRDRGYSKIFESDKVSIPFS